ncbi:hypothetical protein KA005_16130, partial [bacterium]|nr:hypothetical protein [bacterium]
KKAVEDARREIRKQVRSIIRGEWKNIIFERAISVIGKSYSMDAVYKTFKDALQDMHESLSSCKRDMLYKTMWGDESSLEEFAEDIGGIFATLSAKVHVFRQIAMRDIADPETLDMELVSLLDKADMLKKDGDEIAKAITKRARISVKQKKALSLVENLMSKIRKIAETLKHKK